MVTQPTSTDAVTAGGADPLALYRAACATFGELVEQVPDDGWGGPTPCAGWSVRDLVNHVTVEDLWAAELFAGRTIADVGSALDGDQLGEAPVARWAEALANALAAADRPGAMDDIVHLSFRNVPGSEYAMELFADHLVHTWDLATGIGRSIDLDPAAVEPCLRWFADREEAYRAAGAIGPRPDVPASADPQTRLLAAFGRAR